MHESNGHREAAQLQELLSCAKKKQHALSQKEVKHQSHLGNVQEWTSRPLECERRPEDLSGRCVAEASASDDSFERDEDKA